MNSLDIDLVKGDKVVVQGDVPENIRTVTIIDGYGMSKDSRGTALFVKLINGSTHKISGMEIEKLA